MKHHPNIHPSPPLSLSRSLSRDVEVRRYRWEFSLGICWDIIVIWRDNATRCKSEGMKAHRGRSLRKLPVRYPALAYGGRPAVNVQTPSPKTILRKVWRKV